jgi:hypothetical protein
LVTGQAFHFKSSAIACGLFTAILHAGKSYVLQGLLHPVHLSLFLRRAALTGFAAVFWIPLGSISLFSESAIELLWLDLLSQNKASPR